LAARVQILSKGFELINSNLEIVERAALDGCMKLVGDDGVLRSGGLLFWIRHLLRCFIMDGHLRFWYLVETLS
jgi:hypothetical protein